MKYDQMFLNALDKQGIRTQHLRLTLLNFKEEPIREIAGVASGNGTLNLNGASATRRTISFNMIANEDTNNLTNIDNLISINKKFKISIGIENHLKEYQDQGEIIWFPLGLYVISTASLSWNTTSCTITIQAKDKSCLIDGSVGGTLPTTVVFHEIYEKDKDDNYIISYPTIRTIIFEAMTHYGGEPAHNIIINDLEDTTKQLIKYVGDIPMWLQNTEDTKAKNIIISNEKPEGDFKQFSYGEDVGYLETDFTYPGELILSAGESVVALLNKIIEILGNFEFFYDLDGRFIFQRIPTYQDVSFSQLTEINGQLMVREFNNSKYAYSLTDFETVSQINSNPNYANLKNDFIVWGQRPLTGDATKAICYRLTIDEKPDIIRANKYMYAQKGSNSDNENIIVKYEYHTDKLENTDLTLIAEPWNEEQLGPAWREELYRAALEAAAIGTRNSIYDVELLEFWRQNYDLSPKYLKEHNNNPKKFNKESEINYWLDFLDSNILAQYSISNIGCRSKVVNNDKVKTLINPEVPDVIYYQNPGNIEEIQNKIYQFDLDGQAYCFVTEEQYINLLASSTGSSAFDIIREQLYQYLIYNTQITINSIPKYYLEPNNLIYIRDSKSNIIGDYVIKSLSIPLGYNGTMTITANEALTRV